MPSLDTNKVGGFHWLWDWSKIVLIRDVPKKGTTHFLVVVDH